MSGLTKYLDLVKHTETIRYVGKIVKVLGLLLESRGPQASIGEVCQILIPQTGAVALAEVIGLRGETVQLMSYESLEGIEVGCAVIATGEMLSVPVSDKLLGRVIDARANPLDGKGDIYSPVRYPAISGSPPAMSRSRITSKLTTGVRSIDGLIPLGRGQRVGIFAGSGVGKSTLLGMIARNTDAKVNVIALIGERGREVRDFIENDLGEEGLARSVVIVSTSDTSPLARLRGAYVALAVAEYFRDCGNDVLLLFDSVTRFARAQREIGLAIGEPPSTRGYPPSVFDSMPKLLERAGTSEHGSITGIFTILVDADDMDEPVADTVRAILDGHIVLSRALAVRSHYPAVDVLASISRLAPAVTDLETRKIIANIRRHMAVYAENEDMIHLGAYPKGSDKEIDEAIEMHSSIVEFLRQDVEDGSSSGDTAAWLAKIASGSASIALPTGAPKVATSGIPKRIPGARGSYPGAADEPAGPRAGTQ